MFMPYLSTEKDDKMTIVAGLGPVVSSILCAFCIILVNEILEGLGSADYSGAAVAMSSAILTVALILLLFRVSTTIDRKAGVIVKRWGSVLIFRQKRFPLNDYIIVCVREGRNERSSSGRRASFSLKFQGDDKALALKNVTPGLLFNRDCGSKLQRSLERFLGFEHTPLQTIGRQRGQAK